MKNPFNTVPKPDPGILPILVLKSFLFVFISKLPIINFRWYSENTVRLKSRETLKITSGKQPPSNFRIWIHVQKKLPSFQKAITHSHKKYIDLLVSNEPRNLVPGFSPFHPKVKFAPVSFLIQNSGSGFIHQTVLTLDIINTGMYGLVTL